MTNLENKDSVKVEFDVTKDVAEKVDFSNVADELPADEETLKYVDSLQEDGKDFIKTIDGDKELSSIVKKLFPNTYKLAVKSLKKLEKARGLNMTKKEIKRAIDGFINSLTGIINYVQDKLNDPETIKKIAVLRQKFLEKKQTLKEKGLFMTNEVTLNNVSSEEFARNELVWGELDETEKNPALEALGEALKKDVIRYIKLLKAKLNSSHLSAEDKENMFEMVNAIMNIIDKAVKSPMVGKYVAGLEKILHELGGVNLLIVGRYEAERIQSRLGGQNENFGWREGNLSDEENGEWKNANGEWKNANGEWKNANDEWKNANSEWKKENNDGK